ncbi:MAG: CBS domain-containing protein [Thermodesulfobacteriota bacterium]
MSVDAFCDREVVIARRNTPVVEAAQLMRHHHAGDIVVVTDGEESPRPVGISSPTGTWWWNFLPARSPPANLTVGDIMSPGLGTAREQDSLWDTLKRMQGHGIRRMVVVNDQDGLEGILTVDDLLALLGEEIDALAKVTAREEAREKRLRE